MPRGIKNTPEQREAARERACEVSKKVYRASRDVILNRLGHKCQRCEWTDRDVLNIDHILGGGEEMRRTMNWFQQHKYIMANIHEFQLLCANHNVKKMIEECEHMVGFHRRRARKAALAAGEVAGEVEQPRALPPQMLLFD